MVSKSKILGQSNIIFVTTGTTSFCFDRVFKIIDQAIDQLSEIQIIAQTSNPNYSWKYKHTKIYKELNPFNMINIIKKSYKIITHGGFGSMFMISNHSKVMPLIISRLSEFNEHVDDHQKYFLEKLRVKIPEKYNKYLITDSDIQNPIANYINNKSTEKNILGKYVFNSKKIYKLTENLNKFIKNEQ